MANTDAERCRVVIKEHNCLLGVVYARQGGALKLIISVATAPPRPARCALLAQLQTVCCSINNTIFLCLVVLSQSSSSCCYVAYCSLLQEDCSSLEVVNTSTDFGWRKLISWSYCIARLTASFIRRHRQYICWHAREKSLIAWVLPHSTHLWCAQSVYFFCLNLPPVDDARPCISRPREKVLGQITL